MAQSRLDEFLIQKPKEKHEIPAEAIIETQTVQTKKEKTFPPENPENLPPSYFVSIFYDGKRKSACIKLYEPSSRRIYFWYDNTGHKPYCFTNLSPLELDKIEKLKLHPGFDHSEVVEKYDGLKDKPIKVTKIVAKDPLAIGGRPRGCIRDIIPEEYPKVAVGVQEPEVKVWEARIKYYESYIYDRELYPGMLYKIENGNLKPVIDKQAEEMIQSLLDLFKGETSEELEYVERWARLLEYPAAKFRRVALDIEVLSPIPTRVPDPREAAYPVICVSLVDSDGNKRVLLYKREGVKEGAPRLPPEVKIEYFNSEEQLIRAVFDVLWEYPFVITFNGDDFDLRYLLHRAENFGIKRDEIPIELGRRVCTLKYGVHIDLYKFFFNRSIQVYAFGNSYRDVTLDEVAEALIGRKKIPLEKPLSELTYMELAEYCLRDAEITYELTSFNDDLVMKLILVLSRISKMPMEDVSRQGVSRWIRSFLYHEHRRRNMLIPNTEDILAMKGKTATKAIIKGKKYKGAIVVEPVPGVHFNVAVLDFASLYPSIIKVWNLGYQSVLCPHPECRDNLIPDTPHWVCKKKRALESLIIGALRDLRVKWYKPKSKDKTLPADVRNWYSVIQSALKVILNASYGVFGAESFDLYCPPVAEATAAIGRHSLTQIIEKARQLGIEVVYGDTDSVFLKNPTEEQIQELITWSEKELKMGLDVDKMYRYAVFSSRKKNYLGVMPDGRVDVKGLTGKKRHIPLIIKKAFDQLKETLAKVKSPADFEEAKKEIRKIVLDCYLKLKQRKWEKLEDLAFHVVLGETPKNYVKTTPQHVKAARLLEERGMELKAGDLISFVKVVKEPHVKPVQLATSSEIDVDKYIGYLQSTFEQILDALGLDFNEIIGLTKLERFM